MKRKLWLTSLLICLALICVCAFAAADTPVISAEGQNEDWTLTVPVFSDVAVHINAEGATNVRIHAGEDEGFDDITGTELWEQSYHSDIEYHFQYDASCENHWDGAKESYALYAEASYDDGETWEQSNIITVVCTTNGWSPNPVVTNNVPGTIIAGDEIVIDVEPGPNAPEGTFLFADVIRLDSQGLPDWGQYFIGYDAENGVIRIPTGNREGALPVGQFAIAVREAAEGWDLGEINPYIMVEIKPGLWTAEYNEDFVVVDGSTVTVELNQWVHFAARAPGANYISFHALTEPLDENTVLNGENEFGGDFLDPNDREGRIDQQWIEVGFSESITRYIVAQAHYFGDNDTEATAISDVITLNAVCDAEISGNITFTVPEDVNTIYSTSDSGTIRWKVPKDGRLFIDVNNMEGVDYFGAYIKGANDGDPWVADSHWVPLTDHDPEHTTRVPLTVPRCATGNKTVRVFAIKYGAPQKDATKTIPIRVTKASSDCPVILSMGDEFWTGEPLRVFAHYTNPADEAFPEGVQDGALMIRIHEKDNPDNEVFNEMQGFEDFWNDSQGIWQSGTYVIDAYIFQYGEQVRAYEGIKEITVNSRGRTAAPQAEQFTSVEAGQDLELNLTADPEDGEEMPVWFDYALFRMDHDFEFVDAGSSDEIGADGTGTITIPGDRFEAGGHYFIRLFGMKNEYDVGVTEFKFVAVNTDETEQSLTLTINGHSEPVQSELSCTNLHVKVAYGEERPTAIRILNGGNWEYWWGEEDNFERDWGFGDDEILMYAEATRDAIDFDYLDSTGWEGFDWNVNVHWTERSNAIRLYNTNPYGEMWAPDFTIDYEEMGLEENATIPWGDDLIINIADEGPTDADGNVVGGGWFFINLEVERTDEYNNRWWDRLNSDPYSVHGGVNRIPTYMLEANCRYRIEIGADARGYAGRSRWAEFTLGEKPNEEGGNEIRIFTVNGEQSSEEHHDFYVPAGAEIQLGVYRSGAEWYRIEMSRAGDDWRDEIHDRGDGMLLERWRPDRDDTYELTAFACGINRDEEGNPIDEENPGTWQDSIARATIHVSVQGELNEPWVDMPMFVNAGEEIHLNWHLNDGHAEEYSYWISHEDDGDRQWGDSRHIADIRREIGGEADIYDMVIPGNALEANRVYRINLDTMASGYTQGHGERTLYIIGDAETDGSITISGPEELVFSDYFPIEVHADGADEIQVYWEAAGGWRGSDGEHAVQYYIQDWVPGPGHYYEDEDGQKYIRFCAFAKYGSWLKVSPTLYIPFSTENVEDAEAPGLSIGNEGTIYRGDFIEAVVTGISDPGVIEYKVFITDEYGNWVDFASSETAGTLLVPTNNLEHDREYYLQVCATVPGKIRTDSEPIPFSVSEAEGMKFLVSKTQVEVCEPLTVSVVAPGAERIRFSGGYDNWWDYDGWYCDSWYNSDVKWEMSADPDIKICAEAWYPDEEDWTPVGEAHIKVTARGSLPQPEITVPATIMAGQDLNITIAEIPGADFYRIEMRRVDGGELYFDAEAGENRIPGRALNEGGYRIRVIALAYGYNAGQIEKDLFVEPIRPEIRVNSVVSNTSALSIKVPLVEHGTEYYMEIHYVSADNPDDPEASYVYRKTLYDTNASASGILTFKVPKNTLRDGMTHWIDCYVSGEDGFYCENSKAIVVRNGQADSNITIRVNGETGTTASVLIHDDYKVDVDVNVAEGEPEATAIKISCGDHYDYFFGNHVEGATFSEWQRYTETLYAQACYETLPEGDFDWETLNWGAPSNPVAITFCAIGQAGAPGGNMPESVTRGDILVISDIYQGDNANETHANIYTKDPWSDEDGRWVYEDFWFTWDEDARTIYLSTAGMEPGEYWVALDNRGIGYTGNRWWNRITVTEREEQPAGSIILTAPAKVEAGLTMPVSVYAPGALRVGFGIDVREDARTDPGSRPDQFRIEDGEVCYNKREIRYNEPGNHTLTACALFEEGGEWTLLDQAVEICNPLRFDLSGMPGCFTVDQENASVTVPLPENAQRMSVQIYAEGEGYWEDVYNSNGELYEDTTIPIAKKYLQSGNKIRVDFQARADAFREYCDGIQIPVAAAKGTKAELTVHTGDINNVWAEENIEFLVTPAEGETLTAVRFYSGNGWWDGGTTVTPENHPEWFINGSAFFWNSFNEEPGRILTAFAEVKVAGSTAWTRTNELRFTVKSDGPVGAYDFANPSGITVARGTIVEVTFQAAEGADHYWADAFSTWDGHSSWNPRTWNDEGTTTVRISTAGLIPGTYELWGRAGGYHRTWTESNSYILLTVTNATPTMPEATFRTPDALTTIEEEAFEGIGAQVVEISGSAETICSRAFADSGVETVIFRNGNTWINDDAFAGCGAITVYSKPDGQVYWWAENNGYSFYPIP